MYNIIPLILILISLSVIIVIIVRKFPALANLDVENIPAEKEARFKERIISNRLKRNFFKWSSKLAKLIRPIGALINKFFKWAYNRLNKLSEDYKSERTSFNSNTKQEVDQLFIEAEKLKKQDDLVTAENTYIKIIGMDSRNIKAFKDLGQLYFERKDYKEAEQIFKHVLKIIKDDQEACERSQTYFNLALVYQAIGNMGEAVVNIKQALLIEPNNPRYLDIMLDLSIINEDKVLAIETYKKLAEVNPDNQKLEEFKERINKP